MIITFSGTGNSLLVARQLQKRLGGSIVLLEGDMLLHPEKQLLEVAPGENVVWVFPVYSWGMPQVVEAFIRLVRFKGAHEARHFLVVTCGDDIGYTDNCWRSLIGRRGWSPRGSFSVTMPNTYVCLKGFDVDAPDVAQRKLDDMPTRVESIAEAIARGFSGDDVVRGSWAWLKTYVVRPLFLLFLSSPKPFRCDAAKCSSCGLCASSCPMENITMHQGHPVWGSRCALCLRCYHICPTGAVEYGTATEGKGRKKVYINNTINPEIQNERR